MTIYKGKSKEISLKVIWETKLVSSEVYLLPFSIVISFEECIIFCSHFPKSSYSRDHMTESGSIFSFSGWEQTRGFSGFDLLEATKLKQVWISLEEEMLV